MSAFGHDPGPRPCPVCGYFHRPHEAHGRHGKGTMQSVVGGADSVACAGGCGKGIVAVDDGVGQKRGLLYCERCASQVSAEGDVPGRLRRMAQSYDTRSIAALGEKGKDDPLWEVLADDADFLRELARRMTPVPVAEHGDES